MASEINQLIIKNVEKLSKKMIPTVAQMAKNIGIENLGQLNMKMPSTCLPKPELEKVLQLRNQLMTQLNTVFTLNDKLSKITNTIQPTINTTKTSLDIAKTTVNTLGTAMLAIPPSIPVPAPLITGFVNASILVNGTLPSIITANINKLDSITKSTDFANKILLNLKNILSIIDNYLVGCGVDSNNLTSLNEDLQKLDQVLSSDSNNSNNLDNLNTANGINNNNYYNGFILGIEEIPYSPTVKRRRAVAKNSQDITLLSTPLTFSTDDQTLITAIKLIIDSSNLEAN